eukprot:scaffold1504_cov417-Prasinococcus_capsulatus_cf.AAC.4
MLICLEYWTKDEVTIAEAILTIAQFPILLILAYGQDIKWRFCSNSLPEETTSDLEAYKVEQLKAGKSGGALALEIANRIVHKEDRKSSYLKYRVNAIRFMSGGRRIQLRRLKTRLSERIPEEDNVPWESTDVEQEKDGWSSDPYVKVQLGRQKHQTEWKYRNINPAYDETFEFTVLSTDADIIFTVCLYHMTMSESAKR